MARLSSYYKCVDESAVQVTSGAALWEISLEAITVEHLEMLASQSVEEDQQLEYKREAPSNWDDNSKSELRKDVAAMANGGGGTILYGIQEDEEGRASGFQSIAEVDHLKGRIEQILLDCFDPPLQRIALRSLSVKGKDVLLIRVEAPEQPPYSIATGQWNRRFPIRQGRHTRPMTMAEIGQALHGQRMARGIARILDILERGFPPKYPARPISEFTGRELLALADPEAFATELIRRFRQKMSGRPTLRIGCVPSPLMTDCPLRGKQAELLETVRTPPGARPSGWFVQPQGTVKSESVCLSRHDELTETSLKVYFNGAVVFATPLDTVDATWGYEFLAKGDSHVINPIVFIEPVHGVFAMMQRIVESLGSVHSIRFDLGLYNARGYRITPYTADSYAIRLGHDAVDADIIRMVDKDSIEFDDSVPVGQLDSTRATAIATALFEEIGFEEVPSLERLASKIRGQ